MIMTVCPVDAHIPTVGTRNKKIKKKKKKASFGRPKKPDRAAHFGLKTKHKYTKANVEICEIKEKPSVVENVLMPEKRRDVRLDRENLFGNSGNAFGEILSTRRLA